MPYNVQGLAMWRNFVIRQPVTDAKFKNKCSLFIRLLNYYSSA